MAESQYVHVSIGQGEKTIDVTLERSSEWPGYENPHIFTLLDKAVREVERLYNEAEASTPVTRK